MELKQFDYYKKSLDYFAEKRDAKDIGQEMK